MSRFRKKPVVIEAVQWFRHGDHSAVEPHVDKCAPNQPTHPHCHLCGRPGTREEFYASHGWVPTLEGGHIACPGDFIITGVKGEHYPCKPDIFEATYEPVP